MRRYVMIVPHLDECGGIYLPGIGENGAAVRLNENASKLLRELINNGIAECSTEEEQEFFRMLLDMRVIGIGDQGSEAE